MDVSQVIVTLTGAAGTLLATLPASVLHQPGAATALVEEGI